MEMVNIKINGMPLSVPNGISILEAARYAGIEIPTLCFLKDINEIGACRICMVEVKGARSLVTACVYPVNEGMEVFTNTEKVRNSRKITLELILSTHDRKCLSCVRSGSCELQQLCKEFGVDDETRYEGANPHYEFDDSAAHMIRDNNKCILCRRCVAACDMQKISVIGANARGFDTHISSAFDKDLADVSCISCGQCIVNCPTGALVEKDDSDKVLAAINDPEKYVIVQTAPSIRATLGECFGMSIGTNVQGKMVAALRRLGFDKVFDTDFAADLTIMEEAHEFIERVQQGGVLPMITSCSPAGSNTASTTILIRSPTSPPANRRSRCSARRSKPGMQKRWGSIRRRSSSLASCPARRKNLRPSATTSPPPATRMWISRSPPASLPA